MKTLPILVAIAGVMALSGCSSAQNEAPCKDFETTYNAVDLRDKLITVDSRGADYRPSLKKLADTAKAGAEKASGDVQTHLSAIVSQEAMYEKTATQSDLPYTFLDVRGMLDKSRDNLVKGCKDSGYPIELEPDYPVR
ncbi:hypothetical protein [Pseudarthrobacter sp. S9]|uniref:hypothetical protein n=1 Tax=Pseudarthrobacter sp. S9 TaxID=3418421 RepID=UPI003CFEFF47